MIVKSVSRLIQELDAKSFTVIGCPGADGLGPEAMQVFDAAIRGAEGDFIVTLGDVSPLGRDPYYSNVAGFIDSVPGKPMYVMRGNHDGPDYGEYFGHNNCAVLSEDFVLIMLDNSARRFTDDTLAFLQETMAIIDSHCVIVAMHIPPPNRMSGDSLSRAEWSRFEEAAGVWRNRISLILSSHVHGYFEDDVDGVRLVVTGGGGARLQHNERLAGQSYHALEVTVDADGFPHVLQRPLSPGGDASRPEDIRLALEETLTGECRRHAALLMEAEDAEEAGRPNAARLFRAAAEARLRRARNLQRILARREGGAAGLMDGLAAEFDGEGDNCGHVVARATEADTEGDGVAAWAIRAVATGREAHRPLFEAALREVSSGEADVALKNYHVCRSCGLIVSGRESPTYCAACGAPDTMFLEIT